jgi:hypothetical protein
MHLQPEVPRRRSSPPPPPPPSRKAPARPPHDEPAPSSTIPISIEDIILVPE